MGRSNRTIWKCGILLLFFALVLSGCQQKRGDLEHSGKASGEPVSTQNAEKTKQKEQPEQKEQAEEKVPCAPTQEGEQGKDGFGEIQGKITEVFYGNDGDLLMQAEKNIWLYHIAARTVKAKRKVPDLRNLSVRRLDGGYAVVGEISRTEKKGVGMSADSDSADGGWRVLLLDSSLNIRKKINVSNLVGGKGHVSDAECIAISRDGGKIAAATEKGIFLWDVQSKKRRKVLDFAKRRVIEHLVLDGVNQIAFTKNDKKLAFFSSVLPESASDGEESISAWGTVSLNGEGLNMSADADYHGEEMQVYDDCLVLSESFEHNSGRLLKVDMGSGKKSFIPFSDKREGKDGVYSSADGKYFATACLAGKSVTVRIYDMERGRVLLKKTMKNKKEEYFYRIPRIYLMDKEKTCVVVLGAGIEEVETKVEQFAWR
jgi:hypothetical protein